jgi:hypothetical protein
MKIFNQLAEGRAVKQEMVVEGVVFNGCLTGTVTTGKRAQEQRHPDRPGNTG